MEELDRDKAQQPSEEKHTKIPALKYELNKIPSDKINSKTKTHKPHKTKDNCGK